MRTIAPNRSLSILITAVGGILFLGAALDLLPFNRAVWFLCLFFGLTMVAGGIVLLLVKFELPPLLPPPSTDALLGQEQYEQAFKLVLSEQAKPGVDNDSAIQRGVNFLVANGVSPEEAKVNLHSVLISFLEQDSQA